MYAEPARRIVVFLFPRENLRLLQGKQYIEQLAHERGEIHCVHAEDVIDRLAQTNDATLAQCTKAIASKLLLDVRP